MSFHALPPIGVVIATHNRPALLRRALRSVLDQQYEGEIEVVLVFDGSQPDHSLCSDAPRRRVVVTRNDRTRGLAGARNTGILALETALVGFCDDDDLWLPGKLAAQLARLQARPDAGFVTTAMRVDYGTVGTDPTVNTVRLARRERVSVQDLARSRMSMLHSSSFLFRRSAMLGESGFGLVDETIPRSMGEDWDLLLRAARQRPIEHVDQPLVAVLWGPSSYFIDVWRDKNAAHQWLIDHHPEIRANPEALAHMLGKLAFGYAALGERRKAVITASRALRANWHERRVPLALLVASGVPARWITTQLNRRGHGI